MKNTFQTGFLAVGLCLLAGVAAMPAQAQRGGGVEGTFGEGRAVTREPNAGLEARIETDRTQYNADRAVEITLSLTNVSRYDTSFMTPGRGLPYELTVRDGRSGRIVYTLDDRRGAPSGRALRLARDETKTWRELWDGRNDSGNRVPSGVYVVEARIARQRAVSTQIYIGSNGGGGRPGRPGRDDDNGNTGGGNPERPNWPSRPPHGDKDDLPGGSKGNYGNYSDLRATLTSSRTVVRAGDSVQLTFTVQNSGSRPVNVMFTSGQQWDVLANSPSGRAVWHDSDNKRYIQSLTEMTLRPGVDRSFTATWQVPSSTAGGRYEMQAFLTARRSGNGGTVAPASLSLRIIGSGERYSDRGDYGDDYGREDDRNNRDGRYGNRDRDLGYNNPSNRTPAGVVLGTPTIVYGSRSGATLVSPRLLAGRDGTQYVGKKVTVSGQYNGTTSIAGQNGWLLGGEGVILSVVGIPPAAQNGLPATVTGVVRQTPSGQVYLALP